MKGQTAVEYLMTYGWAILIILIVAGVLAYYGIFAPAGFLGPTARGFGQVQVLNPWSLLSTNGAITMNIGNRVGETIIVTSIKYTVDTVDYTGDVTPPVTLSSGQNGIITAPTIAPAFSKKAGDPYTATVTITYSVSGTNFTSTGTLSGTYS